MKPLILFSLFSVLVSCKNISGDLNVTDHLQFINNGKNDYIIEGHYQSKLKVRKKKVILKLKNTYQKSNIVMNLPEHFELPTFDLGEIHRNSMETCKKQKNCDGDFVFKLDAFYLTEADLDQPFGINGMILVHRKKSPKKTAFEQCEILPNINECRVNFPNRNPYSFCREGAQGQRLVTYTDYNYELDFEMFLKQDDVQKAKFRTTKFKTFKEYSQIGVCQQM